MAQSVCDRYDLWPRLPAGVAQRLHVADPAQETPKTIDHVRTFVVANSTLLAEAAVAKATALGYMATIATLELEGEATATGRRLARWTLDAPPRAALIAGGENTVTLSPERLAADGGSGGPNQEAA